MAAVNLAVQLYVSGAWTTYAGYSEEGWSTRVGPDLESGLQPNKIEFTFASDDLSMDPSNVTSPLYGKIGRNTPARLLIDGTTITQAEASSWQPDKTPEHVPGVRGRSWTSIVAEGLLRRLGRWEDPLDSPMTRQISGYTTLTGYWPLEDDSGAARLAQVVHGAPAGTYTGTVNLAGDNGAGGSDKTLTLGSDGIINGRFLVPGGSGYQVCWTVKLAALPTSATYQTVFSFGDTLGRTYVMQVNNTTHQTIVTDADGVVLNSSVIGAVPLTEWTRYRIKVTVSGGTVTYEPAWYTQDASTAWGITATYAGTATGRPRSWTASGNAWTTNAAYGHVFATTDTTLDLFNGDPRSAFNGYLGERAGWRFNRLLGELGLNRYVTNANASPPMGRQKPGKIIDLLEEITRTDGGLIYDEPTDIALTMRPYSTLINLPVSLALTYTTDVSPPLRKVIDDVGVVNDVTVSNWDGTTVRLEQTTGPLSTAPPPAGVGRYKKPVDVSLQRTDHLDDRANWELEQGTLDRPRYQAVVIDLLRLPGYRPAIAAMRPGDLISIAGLEPDIVYLRVINIERKGGAVADTATLNCLPAEVWLTGTYDNTARRLESSSTTLAAGATSTATTLNVTTVLKGDCWSSTSAYDVLIAGERIGIPVGGMSAPAGTGPWTQTATGVTRSKNGVVKAQTAGTEVHVANPARWALGGV